MNRTLTLLFSFLLLASGGYAFQNRLTISSNNNSGVRVLMDGRTYQLDNSGNSREISLTDLRPGRRNIKIYIVKNNGRSRPGNNYSDRNMQLVYNSNLYIRDGVDVDLSINRFGKVFVDEQQIAWNDNDGDRRNDRGGNDNRDWRRDNARPMDDRAFIQLKHRLTRENYEGARLNIAKSAVSDKNVSTLQVKEMMRLFNFENNKLELAKYCLRFVTDSQNYYSVADGLSYSNSKNELLHFIQLQK